MAFFKLFSKSICVEAKIFFLTFELAFRLQSHFMIELKIDEND